MSNDQFDLSGDDYSEYEIKPYNGISLPFHQSRFVSPSPEPFAPLYKSEAGGQKVRVFGGVFQNINSTMTGFADIYVGDFVGEIVASQHGRIIVYDMNNDSFIGWLSPGEYEFTVPFNTESNASWMQ